MEQECTLRLQAISTQRSSYRIRQSPLDCVLYNTSTSTTSPRAPSWGESSEAVTSRHATGETFTQTEFYQKFSILRSIKF
jgi:hypothetical protein